VFLQRVPRLYAAEYLEHGLASLAGDLIHVLQQAGQVEEARGWNGRFGLLVHEQVSANGAERMARECNYLKDHSSIFR
jgi:hypothetical protein